MSTMNEPRLLDTIGIEIAGLCNTLPSEYVTNDVIQTFCSYAPDFDDPWQDYDESVNTDDSLTRRQINTWPTMRARMPQVAKRFEEIHAEFAALRAEFEGYREIFPAPKSKRRRH